MLKEFFTIQEIDEAVAVVRSRTSYQPRVAMILGSGLGDLANSVKEASIIPYKDIPGWPVSTVQGHQGRLVIGKLEGQVVAVMQGRAHYYEGYSMTQVGFPVRVFQRLGVEILVVTNAAGAINPAYEPGSLMLITDHLSLVTMGGENPLRGPNLDEIGERFPDMSQAYDRELLILSRQVAADENISLHEGVYAGLAGPSFETPADLRFLRLAGADAVGMSTVPEVIAARQGGTRVLGLSGISNKANLDGNTITTHAEVLEAGRVIVPNLTRLLSGILQRIG
jgi:purine-nucleoside phosphorylase